MSKRAKSVLGVFSEGNDVFRFGGGQLSKISFL